MPIYLKTLYKPVMNTVIYAMSPLVEIEKLYFSKTQEESNSMTYSATYNAGYPYISSTYWIEEGYEEELGETKIYIEGSPNYSTISMWYRDGLNNLINLNENRDFVVIDEINRKRIQFITSVSSIVTLNIVFGF